MSDPRYPVGKFTRDPDVTPAKRAAWIDQIAETPGRLGAAVQDLNDARLDTPYRDGGWTVRQVTHHVTDSHLNAYIRCKLAVTEDNPPVKTYDEAAWANLTDGRTMSIAPSMAILRALHERWVAWLRTLDEAAFARTAQHPEWGRMRVDDLIQLYAWHGRHHVAHITELRKRMDW